VSRLNRNGLFGLCAITASILAFGCQAPPAAAGGHSGYARGAGPSEKLSDYVAANVKDFSATATVGFRNDDALRKISRDFGLAYKLSGEIHVRYMEPGRMRLDGHLGGGSATLSVDRDTQYVKLSIGLKQKLHWQDEPGKRKTMLDAGLISADYLTWTNNQFMGMRPVDGKQCAMFKLTYRTPADLSHRFVWVDPTTRCVVKREEYNQIGKMLATYYFRDLKEVAPGIWFPSRVEVYNNEAERAGEMDYSNVKVNQGLTEGDFIL
jgi:outer membrane lipoprotein-sorting protein